jgi:hypothetical protein
MARVIRGPLAAIVGGCRRRRSAPGRGCPVSGDSDRTPDTAGDGPAVPGDRPTRYDQTAGPRALELARGRTSVRTTARTTRFQRRSRRATRGRTRYAQVSTHAARARAAPPHSAARCQVTRRRARPDSPPDARVSCLLVWGRKETGDTLVSARQEDTCGYQRTRPVSGVCSERSPLDQPPGAGPGAAAGCRVCEQTKSRPGSRYRRST